MLGQRVNTPCGPASGRRCSSSRSAGQRLGNLCRIGASQNPRFCRCSQRLPISTGPVVALVASAVAEVREFTRTRCPEQAQEPLTWVATGMKVPCSASWRRLTAMAVRRAFPRCRRKRASDRRQPLTRFCPCACAKIGMAAGRPAGGAWLSGLRFHRVARPLETRPVRTGRPRARNHRHCSILVDGDNHNDPRGPTSAKHSRRASVRPTGRLADEAPLSAGQSADPRSRAWPRKAWPGLNEDKLVMRLKALNPSLRGNTGILRSSLAIGRVGSELDMAISRRR